MKTDFTLLLYEDALHIARGLKMDLKNIFAERLMRARQQKGLSQRQLALAVGISPRAAGQYEQGQNLPSLETFILLTEALDVSADYLLGLTEQDTPDQTEP